MTKKLNKKKGKYTQNLKLIGTIIAILFWWYDAYVDTYIFLDGEFVDNMLHPETKDIWMRLTVMASLIGLSFYSHKLIARVKRAEELKDHFVSTVSHELRTPLTSIIGSLDILRSGMAGEVSEESKKIVGIAYRNSNRLLDLINDILDLQKLETGLMTYRIAPMPVAPMVDRVIESIEGIATQYNVTLKVENNAPDVLVKGDKERLAQVMTNLIANAIRHSPSGKDVTIDISQSGTLVRIAVIDHGPGVPQEFKNRIFTQFAQAESGDVYGKGGTGLGLSISKQIIERHEGRISFISDPGVATSFYFDIPEFIGDLPVRAPAGEKDMDEVTSIFNWSYFEKELEIEWARGERAKSSLALILIEVIGLEAYYEKHGKEAGNEALRKIATTLRRHVKRPGDLMARYTSDQFVALLPDTDKIGADVVLEGMCDSVGGPDMGGLTELRIQIGCEAVRPSRSIKSDVMFKGVKESLMERKQTSA